MRNGGLSALVPPLQRKQRRPNPDLSRLTGGQSSVIGVTDTYSSVCLGSAESRLCLSEAHFPPVETHTP